MRSNARTRLRAGIRTSAWICTASWVLLVSTPSKAADEASLLRDLTSVIALLGLPCGQVVSAKPLKDDDHIATCQDGSRYRVFVNAAGRVVAERLKP